MATGVVTFVIAIVGYFLLPDFPLTTTWLTEEERQLAHNRMELDTVSNKGSTSTWQGFQQASKDPMVWIFAAMAHMHLAANGFKNFVSVYACRLSSKTTNGAAVPHRRANTWILRDHHPRPHVSPLPHRWRGDYCRFVVVWQVQRTYMAHHAL